MPYTVELDIAADADHSEVVQFANEHGCRVVSRIEEGPAGGNPCYTFASDSFDMIQELTEQVLGQGHGFDEEELKTMIVEV
jgi:hypothetical protein